MLALPAVMCLKLLSVIMTSAWADSNVQKDTVNRATRRPEEAFPWSQPQLPTSIKPDQYFLSIHPDLGTDSFTGRVHILLTVLNDTRLIVLNSKGLSITEATLQDVTVWGTLLHRDDSARQQERPPARDPVTLRMLESTGTEQLALLSDVLLVPGCKYKLYLSYSGTFSGGYSGIYKASYRSPADASPRYIVATHFEPSSARKAFPCFDEPNRKAQFSLAVVRQRGHVTLSNMPKLYTKVREDGLEEDFYQSSVRMSSYLLAFVVCDYSVNSAETKRGVKVSVFTASHQVNQTHHALHTAVEILDFYEELFQIAYPLPKLDLVTIPDFEPMAMENWGLVMFRDWSLLHQDHRDGVRGQFWVSLITAHELAHQWFGNLVTMHWWKDLWLNEGFASYLEHVVLRHIEPDWCEPVDEHLLMNTLTALDSDSMLTSHPLSLSVSSSTQINEMFDEISYYKGASIIAMLNAYLSEPVFICGIRHYLKEHCYGTATPDDLWRAMTEAAQRRNMTVDVKALMDTWITQRGYPLVTASVHGARLYLRQSPFTILAHNDTRRDAAVWQIPFTFYTSNSSSVFTHLMKGKEEAIQLPEQVAWIKANVNSSGFYRVSYDSLTLRALVTQLQGGQSVLSPADRTGLMDDTFHLARQGSVRYSDAFTLSMFLTVEEEYLPITVFIHNMRNIIIKMAFAREPCITRLLKQHLWSMLGRQALAQRWEDTGSLAVQNKRKNLLEVAMQAGRSPTSEQEALRLFHFWMARDGDYPLPSTLRGLIFQVGVMKGDDVEWTFLLHRYCNCTSSKERALMLAALSRTSDQEKILWLLSNSLQNHIIKTQDLAIIVNIVTCRARSNEIAWTFLQKHWDQLVEKFPLGSPYLSGIVTATTSHFSCTKKYDEVYEFFVTEKRLDHLHFVRRTLETIKANIHWLKTSTVAIRSWLQKTYIYTFKTCPLCRKEYTYHFRWGTTFHIDV